LGLYRAAYEKDSCGFGSSRALDDQASHWVVQTAISSLNRLTHRGAIAADGKTGDGCGLLIKMPTRSCAPRPKRSGLQVGTRFAAGLVFLDRDPSLAAQRAPHPHRANAAREIAGRRLSRLPTWIPAPAARRR
jgi:glutamate synthase (NADPH/NADH) large chain